MTRMGALAEQSEADGRGIEILLRGFPGICPALGAPQNRVILLGEIEVSESEQLYGLEMP